MIDEEFTEVAAMLGTGRNIPGTGYYVRQTRPTNVYDVVLTQLDGRGNIRSNSATTALIEAFRPPYILMVGIAGGVKDRDGTGIGDVIVPNFVDYYEMRKLVDGKSLRRSEPYDHPGCSLRQNFAQPVARRKDWLKYVDDSRRPTRDGGVPTVRIGLLISGEKVLGDDDAEIQQRILSEFDNALAVDMESFGLASAVYTTRSLRHYNPQFLIVRGISDLIRHLEPGQTAETQAVGSLSNNETRRLWKRYAAHVAAAFALGVIDEIAANTVVDEPIPHLGALSRFMRWLSGTVRDMIND